MCRAYGAEWVGLRENGVAKRNIVTVLQKVAFWEIGADMRGANH